MSDLLHDRITTDYYKTTAARNFKPDLGPYERSAETFKRRLAGWLPKNRDARCLDIACGCGQMVYALEKLGYSNCAGVDLCQDELDMAALFTKAHYTCADVLEFLREAESESFEFISALNFLEHLSKDKLMLVLTEARRVLRPGGALVAIVPNAVSPFGTLTRHWDLTHEWAFTYANFGQLSALAGFDPKIDFRECGPVPHGFISMARYLLWQGIRLLIWSYFMIELADAKGSVYTMDMLVRLHVPA